VEYLAVMCCAMLAGCAPLALLFLPTRTPVPPPEPTPRVFVPRPQWPMKCTCPLHGTPLGQDYECETCGRTWEFTQRARWML
jgi:hypothetical protein